MLLFMEAYQKGQKVRFTQDNLGTTSGLYDTRMTEHIVNAGDTGTYIEPHKALNTAEGEDWHIVAVNLGLAVPYVLLYVPVHSSMFEVVS
jgi:hypothetical protein